MGKWVKLTHSTCRGRVCFLCFSKTNGKESIKTKSLQTKLLKKFSKIISFDSGVFDLKDPRVPFGLCGSCSIKLNKDQDISFLYENFDFVFPSETEPCDCLVCKTGKNKEKNLTPNKKDLGRPKENVPTISMRCDRCLDRIGPGGLANHQCSSTKLVQVVSQKFQSPTTSKARLGEAVAANVLKGMETSPSGTLRLKQLHGKEFKVSAGPAKAASPREKVSVNDLLDFQVKHSLSDAATRRLATFSNQKVGRGTVEKNFKQTLASKYSHFDSDFFCTPILFQTSVKTFEELPLVGCKNLSDFALKIFNGASLAPQHFQLKLGIDKGDNCLKMSLSFVCVSTLANPRPNEVFIVAMVEGIPENYHNIQVILKQINAHEASFLWSGDLKMLNILCGIQQHTAKHPCYACEQPKESLHLYTAPQRTLGTLIDRHTTYLNSKQTTRDLNQVAKNCKYYPLIASDPLEPSQASMPTILLVPPPELHLMEGPINDIFQDIQELFPSIAKEWVHLLSIPKKEMHGGVFNGNGCKKLLDNADLLESLAIKYECFGLIPYVRIFRSFSAVVKSCFGGELDHDYYSKILEFKNAILFSNTCLSIKTKLHFIWYHVPEFLEWSLKGLGPVGGLSLGLGKLSEQDIEKLHHTFFKYSSRYLCWSKNPKYLKKAHRAVSTFNSKMFHQFLQAHKK